MIDRLTLLGLYDPIAVMLGSGAALFTCLVAGALVLDGSAGMGRRYVVSAVAAVSAVAVIALADLRPLRPAVLVAALVGAHFPLGSALSDREATAVTGSLAVLVFLVALLGVSEPTTFTDVVLLAEVLGVPAAGLGYLAHR